MKKLIPLFIAVVLFNPLIAQMGKRGVLSSYQLGAKEGVTVTQISADGHVGFMKAGMVGGFYLRNKFKNQKACVQFEVLYSEKGSRWYAKASSDTAASPSPYYEPPTLGYLLRLHYIEFPLIYQYNFRALGAKGLFFEGGLS